MQRVVDKAADRASGGDVDRTGDNLAVVGDSTRPGRDRQICAASHIRTGQRHRIGIGISGQEFDDVVSTGINGLLDRDGRRSSSRVGDGRTGAIGHIRVADVPGVTGRDGEARSAIADTLADDQGGTRRRQGDRRRAGAAFLIAGHGDRRRGSQGLVAVRRVSQQQADAAGHGRAALKGELRRHRAGAGTEVVAVGLSIQDHASLGTGGLLHEAARCQTDTQVVPIRCPVVGHVKIDGHVVIDIARIDTGQRIDKRCSGVRGHEIGIAAAAWDRIRCRDALCLGAHRPGRRQETDRQNRRKAPQSPVRARAPDRGRSERFGKCPNGSFIAANEIGSHPAFPSIPQVACRLR